MNNTPVAANKFTPYCWYRLIGGVTPDDARSMGRDVYNYMYQRHSTMVDTIIGIAPNAHLIQCVPEWFSPDARFIRLTEHEACDFLAGRGVPTK